MNNLWLKLLSLLLALTVWVFVSAPRREPVSERPFAVPVSFTRMPRELVITNADQVPSNVTVRLRGRVSDLRSIASQNLEVTLDMSWVQPGEATITLLPKAINVPPQIEVLSMEPTRLRFRIEPLREKVVAIRPFLVGDPPSGYDIGDPLLEPAQALVSGPASQMGKLTEVATERIIMTGRTATFTQSVAVVSDASLVRVIEPLTTQVTVPVTAEIGPQPLESEQGAADSEQQKTKKNENPVRN
jgi:YbbR domain-containing protein